MFALSRDYRMTMNEPKTDDDWPQFELDVGRLFSAAPLSPVGSPDYVPGGLDPGRASEVRLMMQAVRDPAKHILLYGERGLGKTSLANTFWRGNGSTTPHPLLVARVQACPFDDFSSLWSRALVELQTAGRLYSQEIRSDFEQVSPDTVRREFQKIPRHIGVIMIVDEFDLLQEREARLLTANLLKSLHDYSVNVTILLIGVAENVDELIINHQSLRRVLSLIKLERMSKVDLNEVLDSRLRLTPLEFSDDARSEIVSLSCGLPYYVQILGRFSTQNAITHRRMRVQVEDMNAAIDNFLVESGQSFVGDYQRAIDSRQTANIFQEVILASALAFSDASSCFKPSEVHKALRLISPAKDERYSRIQQYLSQLASDRRGRMLIRRGMKPDYQYRFSDALMQPFIIMRAIKDGMIDERLRRVLFHSGSEQFRNGGYRLGVAKAYAAQLGMIIPAVTEGAGEENPAA